MLFSSLEGDTEGYPTAIAETNHEMLCPLYHGEVYTIKKLSEQSDRPKPEAGMLLARPEWHV